jgi:mevalonate kinase
MKISVYAPGKLMLLGEHAVVYGYPCIVTAVSSKVKVELENTLSSKIQIDAPQVKDVSFVEESIRIFKEKFKFKDGLLIKTYSEFSSQYGFGSSSAVTVATLYGLSRLFNLNLTKKQIFDLGLEVTLNIQKVGSGFDIAAATFGKTLYFIRGGKKIEKLNIDELPLVVGYSGIKASTPKIVQQIKERLKKEKKEIFKIFDLIGKIVEEGKKSLSEKNYQRLGKLMNENHMLLKKLGVSTKKLDQMCEASISAGAYGAKLSGAGGGDCIIALVPLSKKGTVEKAIENVGGKILKVRNNVSGVGYEKNI